MSATPGNAAVWTSRASTSNPTRCMIWHLTIGFFKQRASGWTLEVPPLYDELLNLGRHCMLTCARCSESGPPCGCHIHLYGSITLRSSLCCQRCEIAKKHIIMMHLYTGFDNLHPYQDILCVSSLTRQRRDHQIATTRQQD